MKRKKAFIGAAIGAVGSIVGGLIQNNQQRKAQVRAKREEVRNKGFQEAANLTNSYGNQDYTDEYDDKIVFKGGGKCNLDRVKRSKKFMTGGRKSCCR